MQRLRNSGKLVADFDSNKKNKLKKGKLKLWKKKLKK